MGTKETAFPPGQQFLVYFSKNGYDGLKAMSLEDIDDMVDHIMTKVAYPFELYYNEFEWETIKGFEDIDVYFHAWPIPVDWRKPPFIPVYSYIGYFPDWEIWDTKKD